MKPNVWNIKEILNIRTGSGGPSKGGATSDYSSMTDSQFLFGSQLWPEHSQGLSQEMSFPSRNSQQNSQEATELKMSTNYHTKPYLFGGDCSSILDRFEEDKKKAKDKCESEILTTGFLQLHESLEHMKLSLNRIDGSSEIALKTLAEGFNGFTKTIQENMASVSEGITSQFEVMLNKLNSQSQTLREMEDREVKTAVAAKDLSSRVQDLQQGLEILKVEQSREQSMLGEVLSLLGTLMASHAPALAPSPIRMMDSTVQTSPNLVERFCMVSEEKCYFEGMRLCGGSVALPGEAGEVRLLCPANEGPIENMEKCDKGLPSRVLCPLFTDKEEQFSHTETEGMRKSTWQRSYCTRSAATRGTSPMAATTALQDSKRGYALRQEATFREHPAFSCILGAPRCPELKEPVKPPLEHPGNIESTIRQEVAPSKMPRQKRALKKRHRAQPFRRKRRALILPQGRPACRTLYGDSFEDSQYSKEDHKEQECKGPLSPVNTRQHPSKAVTLAREPFQRRDMNTQANKSAAGQLNPWNVWSQDSSSSQCVMGYEKTVWEPMRHKPKAQVTQRGQGFWQLFDVINDSD